MGKVLVVSYSLGGTTRIVADEIARALDADSYEIMEARKRSGIRDYLLAGLESLAKGMPSIRDDCQPATYDLVVLGTPVWAGSMASPMRSFLFAHRHHMKRVACFCTMSARGATGTLREMALVSGAGEATTFSARECDVQSGDYRPELDEFVGKLQMLSNSAVSAVA